MPPFACAGERVLVGVLSSVGHEDLRGWHDVAEFAAADSAGMAKLACFLAHARYLRWRVGFVDALARG
jgi:hypothetical protein